MAQNIQYPGSLHNHTDFSNLRLRDCIIKTEELISYAGEIGHQVVAITEHESLSNHIKAEEYYEKIKEKYPNLKLILGNEIYLCRNGLNSENYDSKKDKYYHFILLAKDAIGHQQIREISSRAWNRSYLTRGMRRVPTYYKDLLEIIGANPGHVIGSTACLGGCLGTQLLKYRENKNEEFYEKIKNWCLQLEKIFGKDNFFLELQPSKYNEQLYVNREIIKLSKLLNIPYIITTDSHYLLKQDAPIHEAFLNAQNGEREVKSFYATTYMMCTNELESYLDLTEEEIIEGYNNILKIRDMCESYSLKKPLKIPALYWKKYTDWSATAEAQKYCAKIPTLSEFINSDYSGDKVLANAVLERLINDKNNEFNNEETFAAIEDNLQKTLESSKVNNTHWSAYFLNLQRIVELCWEAGTLVGCGRGSGVGFILLYLLGITQINPLREKIKTHSFRFLNPSRVSVLDVDIDIEGGRRADVLKTFRTFYGENRVANVATFRTEKSKSAVLTAARGLGIDVDIAQYIASLIPADRGQLRSLDQCMYGDEENDFAPIGQFVIEMQRNYPQLWNVAHKIEGLICGSGIHAGGVIFVDEDFENSTALMRAPDGTICTQFDLHDCEKVSLIKMDLLSVEAMDKIHICLDLLSEYGYIEPKKTLKETYEDTIGIYNIERDNPEMWEMVWDQRIHSLFQMEKQSGIQGIALTKPKSVEDLAHLNSIIRLMAQEKGGEIPLSKYARFKNNIDLWYKEMESYGLTKEEQKLLEPIVLDSYGICESQEAFMQLVQIPECGGFDLNFADQLRKAIAKKNPKAYDELTKVYFKTIEEKGLSYNLCNYVWSVLVATSRGYGFNLSHTLAYSLIGLQEMNLAYNFPITFWNCACLINDAGGAEEEKEEEEYFYDNDEEIGVDEFAEEEEEEEDEEEDEDNEKTVKQTKNKKKTKSVKYGKISAAIGKIQSEGTKVGLPNINKSGFTFIPDCENNIILYGLRGISRIGEDLALEIINNRPYTSLEDFLSKVKVNKTQAINLIKSGCFDEFGPRFEIMENYLRKESSPKKRITLQNMAALIKEKLLPQEYDFHKSVFNFNKYLKNFRTEEEIKFDDIAYKFYSTHFDTDILSFDGKNFIISRQVWEKKYKKIMEEVKPYLQSHQQELLDNLNNRLFVELWDKYCSNASLSKWEMDSVGFYYNEHELEYVSKTTLASMISDFNLLPEEPLVDKFITMKDGKQIPIMKLTRIVGTVVDKDKNKNTVTLSTPTGIVTVKVYKSQFAKYDKQISIKLPNGKKKIVEKSWFTRGNKILITGLRRQDNFIPKTYKNHPFGQYPFNLITSIENGKVEFTNMRAEETEE